MQSRNFSGTKGMAVTPRSMAWAILSKLTSTMGTYPCCRQELNPVHPFISVKGFQWILACGCGTQQSKNCCWTQFHYSTHDLISSGWVPPNAFWKGVAIVSFCTPTGGGNASYRNTVHCGTTIKVDAEGGLAKYWCSTETGLAKNMQEPYTGIWLVVQEWGDVCMWSNSTDFKQWTPPGSKYYLSGTGSGAIITVHYLREAILPHFDH